MKVIAGAMDDRKRSVPHDPSDDAHPPFKRQALQSSSTPHSNHQVPQSQEDVIVSIFFCSIMFVYVIYPREHTYRKLTPTFAFVQHFQKEAIWRQMQEYKRERNMLEARVEQLDKRSAYHDDHLRVVDAWWTQVRTYNSRF